MLARAGGVGTNGDALERWKAQFDVALAGLTSREQLGRLLQKRYEELLSGD